LSGRFADAARAWLAVAALALALGACSKPLAPESFAGGAPRFDPFAFFEGRVVSTGVVENASGRPTDRVETESTGRREGNALVVEQSLRFGDGTQQSRTWRLTETAPGRYAAKLSDGEGAGAVHGDLLHLLSTISLKPGNPLYDVTFDQWMRMSPDGTMVNRTRVLKAGVVVAFVTEHFRKR
jgi:hypothetical protein